jgi:hypothetical protein
MSTRRIRQTWRDRQASPPPATPGYGTENTDHPATQPDPGADDYNIGGPSEFAEDVHPPPYEQSSPPATPGYGTENMDHPAVKKGSLEAQVHAKAAKCLRVASAMLGPDAPSAAVEDQALDLMDVPVRQLNATLARISGDFMACGDPMAGQNEPTWHQDGGKESTDDLFADDDEDADDEMLAQLLEEDLLEDEMVMDDEVMLDDPMVGDEMMARWASLGFDNDGFATLDGWKGNRAIFATVDTDKDNIITLAEYRQAMWAGGDEADDMMAGLDEEEEAMLQAMLAEEDEGPMGMPIMAADDDDDDDSDDSDDSDDDAEGDDDSDDSDDDSDDDEGSDKEAAVFAMQTDPMGLSGAPATTPEEDALLAEIFGGRTAADEDADEEADDADDAADDADEAADDADEEAEEADEKKGKKKASVRTASQRPKPRKPGRGPKTLGNLAKTASGPNEVDELSKLWASAPDVSDVFGS